MGQKSLIALDLDGTITAGKSPIEEKNKRLLDELCSKYRVVVVGAGYYERIISQLGASSVDVIGNYGMQIAEHSRREGEHILVRNDIYPIERECVKEKAEKIFSHFGLSDICGEPVTFFPSGCFTLALLGTEASRGDKMKFDPTRERRRSMHPFVSSLFPEYNVFIGGNASLDIAPANYTKYKALCEYCARHKIPLTDVVFCGNDFGKYGNDESVYLSDIDFIAVDDYRRLDEKLAHLI